MTTVITAILFFEFFIYAIRGRFCPTNPTVYYQHEKLASFI